MKTKIAQVIWLKLVNIDGVHGDDNVDDDGGSGDNGNNSGADDDIVMVMIEVVMVIMIMKECQNTQTESMPFYDSILFSYIYFLLVFRDQHYLIKWTNVENQEP